MTAYTSTYPVVPASIDYMPTTADFHLKAGAPGRTKGKAGIAVKGAITINVVTYTPPASSVFIGALGTN